MTKFKRHVSPDFLQWQRQGREGDGVGKGTGPLVELSIGGRREAAR